MSYSTNSNLEKSRGKAMKLLFLENYPVQIVADRFGVDRGFKFKAVQADNGPEFGQYFAEKLETKGISIHHTRLHRPNDNAHIERFNRTIQEECTGSYTLDSDKLEALNQRIAVYLDFYNCKRIHLGLKYMTPVQMLQRC